MELPSHASGAPRMISFCWKSIGSSPMRNLQSQVKFMTFHATSKVHGKNQTILKIHDFTFNFPFLKFKLENFKFLEFKSCKLRDEIDCCR